MRRTVIKYLVAALIVSGSVFGASVSGLQNSDFATSASILGAGGSLTQLLNTSKVWNDLNSELLNTTLSRISGSVLSVGTFGSSPNSSGASVASQILTLQPASATFPGGLSTTTQSIAGNKTFTGTIAASNLSGTNTGDVTLTAVGSSPNANGASLSGQALTLQPADLTNPGVLTAAAQTFGGVKTFNSPPIIDTFTPGSVAYYATGSVLNQDAGFFTWDGNSHRLGLLTSAPSINLGIGGGANRTIGVERNPTTTGDDLNIQAGGAVSGGTDLTGGSLVLRSGISTGTGLSNILFKTYTPNTSSSTSDNGSNTRMAITGGGFVGIGTTSPTGVIHITGTRTAPAALGSAAGSFLEINSSTLNDTFSSGSINNVVAVRSGALTYSPTNATTVSVAIGMRVQPPIAATNATFTSVYGLLIPATAVATTGTVTNAYGLSVTVPTTATNNYAATFTGNVGFGGNSAPSASIDVSAGGVTANSSESIMLTSNKAAIVAGNLINGIAFRSNDSNLTSPGTNVAYIDALAEATHTASVLDTALAFYTTKTLATSERMRLTASGSMGIGTTSPTNQLHTTGSVRFANYGAGATSFDVNGTLMSGTLSIANGGTGQVSASAAFNALSPNNTSGDITVYNGSANQRLAVGANGTVLTADNTVSGGVKWASSGGGGFTNSIIQMGQPNGFGSTNTNVRRWTSTLANTGSDITLTSSATNGDSFTINTTGIYSISVSDLSATAGSDFFIKVNDITTTLTYAAGLRAYGQINVNGFPQFISWTGLLNAGDVVREVQGGGMALTPGVQYGFTITRVH